jgi:nucleoside-diphosphate-sugar epimerase
MSQVVVITGASGFIGRWTRDALLDRGYDVVALRRPASPAAERGRSEEVDYADPERVARVFDALRPAYVVHVAGATKGVTYADFQRANVRPTAALLEAVKASGPPLRRFVHVSSLASFGPSTLDTPHVETATPTPIEFYGQSKLEAERLVESGGVPYTILRPGGVYGPGDVDYFNLFKSAAQGWNVYFGNRKRAFSKIYISDMVRLILAAAFHPRTENKGYFTCDGAPVTWEEFQSAIVAQAERPVRELDLPGGLVGLAALGGELMSSIDKKPRLFNRQKAAMGRAEAWTCDPSALFSDLGIRAEVQLEEGVEKAWAWYRTAGWVPRPRGAAVS